MKFYVTSLGYTCLYIIFSILTNPRPISGQVDESWKVYNDSEVAVVEITLKPEDLQAMYNNPHSDMPYPASFHFSNPFIDEIIDSVAIRIRGNTSRDAQKKSFKIDFNEYHKGKKFYRLDNLNLNGEHNDPSIIRSKLVWNIYHQIGMKSSRAAHTKVYINGKYYGLYISVEPINDRFIEKNFDDDSGNLWKCLYPADLVFKGKNQELYKYTDSGRRVYELNTNTSEDDYSALAHLIDIINNTPSGNFADSLENVLSVPEVLKYFAVNFLTGSWDDYWFLKNNYYLYYEPAKGIFHWIPYDTDNSFGVDWFNIDWTSVNPYTYATIDNTPRPLAQRIMADNQYSNLYTHFLQFYLNNVYDISLIEPELNRLQSMIIESVVADSFRTLDYGFTLSDFYNSYSASGFSKLHVKRSIKEFINLKRNYALSHLAWKDALPNLYNLNWYPKSPTPNDTVTVTVSAFSNSGLKNVKINFLPDGTDQFQLYNMEFDPIPNTKKVEEADRWIGKLPINGKSGQFIITTEDNGSRISSFPRSNKPYIKINESKVLLNEIMTRNESFNADPDGEYEDWIELFNGSPDAINLSGKYLTDARKSLNKWKFPDNTVIQPGKFIIVWCDEDTLQQGLHANFKLDADGEFIALVDNNGATILDSVNYPTQTSNKSYGRIPDGSGMWMELYPSPMQANVITAIKENLLSVNFELLAYPNPFNPSTTIQYSLPERTKVLILVFDMLGRKVRTITDDIEEAGTHLFKWNGETDSGNKISSGIYICRIEAGKYNRSLKLVQIK